MHATRDEMIKLVVAMTVTTCAIFAGVPLMFRHNNKIGPDRDRVCGRRQKIEAMASKKCVEHVAE
ncbi:MAG: hypothetical protein DME59_03600 [Verrucomicrobia bacterium]|nr:MAG: hypothetical protein DME59_03600 [Verrucomicrobiota bacterium]